MKSRYPGALRVALATSVFVLTWCASALAAGPAAAQPSPAAAQASPLCDGQSQPLLEGAGEASKNPIAEGPCDPAPPENPESGSPSCGCKPAFTIEKRQEIAGSRAGFTTAPLTGAIGQTVDYEIVVANTGDVPETFSAFTDTHCDAETLAGGPGTALVGRGQSTTYTCSHVLRAAGSYTNEATVTGTSIVGMPVTHASNQVVVEVPPQPAFTIEKLQRIGSGAAFTTATLTGAGGQVVEYEIVVKNTGEGQLSLSGFSDSHCDANTLVSPAAGALAPGSSATYKCARALMGAGSYVNEASVTGTTPGAPPLSHTSNKVEVNVPASQPAVTRPTPIQQVLSTCTVSPPVLRGASGPKNGRFTAQLSSLGIKQVTFYLDGRKLKTLARSQARGGKYTIAIDTRKLGYGTHRLAIKTVSNNVNCPAIARTSVFVRPRPLMAVKFTG